MRGSVRRDVVDRERGACTGFESRNGARVCQGVLDQPDRLALALIAAGIEARKPVKVLELGRGEPVAGKAATAGARLLPAQPA